MKAKLAKASIGLTAIKCYDPSSVAIVAAATWSEREDALVICTPALAPVDLNPYKFPRVWFPDSL